MEAQLSGRNDIPSCHGGLENLDEEHSYWIDTIEGDVPTDLTGTFFRNGPGRQRIGKQQYGHWFDGDGMVCAFTFKDGKAHFKNAYVKTPKYLEETAAQAIRYRGFGTQIPGGLRANFLKMPANPANTNTIYHGGKLLALNEGGHPWQLAPEDLATVGEYDYDGEIGKSQIFSAHGKVHPGSGDYINFGAGMSGFGLKGPKPCLHLYRINAAGKMVRKNSLPLTSFPFCHDFALSNRYGVFFINSIVFGSMGSVLLGTKTISDNVRFDANQPMRVYIVDLETLEKVGEFETDPGAIIHFGNAFEDGDEIIVDGMHASDFDANETLTDVFNPDGRFGGGQYRRYRFNLTCGTMRHEVVSGVESEFPTFNTGYAGQRHAHCYTACSIYNGANSFFNGIQKVAFDGNADVLELPKGLYGSEPLFAPADGARSEDDGYLLEVVYNGFTHRSELHILRAQDINETVATLHLKHHLPHQFHGYFTPNVFMQA